MSETSNLGQVYLKELEAEAAASRKCLERIPAELFEYKPHEKSMKMSYLALMVAEIPKWISTMLNDSELDFATFEHLEPKTTDELVAHLDENLEAAKKALEAAADEDFNEDFSLKNNGELLYKSPKKGEVSSAINHLVHHRGQLTVYMRLNDIAVPSIYGPSADDRSF